MTLCSAPARIFHVCVIAPQGFVHYRAFEELKDLLVYSLRDLGCVASEGLNQIEKGKTNIIIGAHLLAPEVMASMPDGTIVLNTEQIGNLSSPWEADLIKWCARFETWDYSLKNIEQLGGLGIHNVRHLQIGYHPGLARIPRVTSPEIDVLFYGSLGPRRKKILSELMERKLNVKVVFGAYGAERDRLIANSKLILNMHHFETKVFEIIRVFYLMTNSKAVIAEVGPDTHIDGIYLPGFHSADYEDLVQACVTMVERPDLRRALEEQAFVSFSKLPQTKFLRPLI